MFLMLSRVKDKMNKQFVEDLGAEFLEVNLMTITLCQHEDPMHRAEQFRILWVLNLRQERGRED